MLPQLLKCILHPRAEHPKLCRVCLQSNELQPFNLCLKIECGSEPSRVFTVRNLLQEVTGTEDVSSEIFGGICEDCLEGLKASFIFKMQCLRAYQTVDSCLFLMEAIVQRAQTAPPSTTILAQVSPDCGSTVSGHLVLRNYESHENNFSDLVFQNEILQCSPGFQNLEARVKNEFEENVTSHGFTNSDASYFEAHVKNELRENCKDDVSQSTECQSKQIDGGKRSLQCHHCGKVFKCLSTLDIHLAYHGKPSYPCECSKSFKSKSDLSRHIRTVHLKEKRTPYICNYCGKALTTKYSLEIHIKIHEPKGEFECKICHKVFQREILLRKHKDTHNNYRPEQCEICGNRFVNKKALLYHNRLHTGHRPFQCVVCKMQFISENRRNMHFKHSHTEKKIPCTYCGLMFHTMGRMRTHLKKVHHGTMGESDADITITVLKDQKANLVIESSKSIKHKISCADAIAISRKEKFNSGNTSSVSKEGDAKKYYSSRKSL